MFSRNIHSKFSEIEKASEPSSGEFEAFLEKEARKALKSQWEVQVRKK